MAWSDVESSIGYKGLPPDQKVAAQQQYFNQVVQPQIKDPAQLGDLHAQFTARAAQGMRDTANSGYPGPGDLTPEQYAQKNGSMTADQAAGALNKVGAAAGVAAPFLAASAADAPMLPVAAGLGAAGLVGAGVKKASDAMGLTSLLQKGSDALMQGGQKPGAWFPTVEPHSTSVPWNMIGNMGNELSPRGILANGLTAIPDTAAALAGGLAAGPAEEGAQGLGRLLLGTPKVPLDQSGNAVLQALQKTHGTAAPDVSTTGQFRDALNAGRDQMGAPVKAAQAAADASAKVPTDFPSAFDQAVQAGLQQGTKVPGNLNAAFSKDPATARAIQAAVGDAQDTLPNGNGVDSIAKARALQGQFSQEAARLRQPVLGAAGSKVNAPGADVYSNVAGSIDTAIKGMMTPAGRQGLEAANAPFSSFADAQTLFQKANTKGQFDPSKAKALWDTLSPAKQAKMDPSGYFGKLMDTGDPGVISKLGDALGAAVRLPLKLAGRGNGLGALLSQPTSSGFQFAAPQVNAPTAAMQAGGGLSGLLGAQASQ